MSFNDHFEQLHRTSQKLQFRISNLFVGLFLQLQEAGFKNLLLVVLVGQLGQHEDIVVLGVLQHILFQQFY